MALRYISENGDDLDRYLDQRFNFKLYCQTSYFSSTDGEEEDLEDDVEEEEEDGDYEEDEEEEEKEELSKGSLRNIVEAYNLERKS